jgi:hypothetical protein
LFSKQGEQRKLGRLGRKIPVIERGIRTNLGKKNWYWFDEISSTTCFSTALLYRFWKVKTTKT